MFSKSGESEGGGQCCRTVRTTVARAALIADERRPIADSAGVRDLPLAAAGLALDGIDSTTWLLRLLDDRKARSIAGSAGVFFDFWRHTESFMHNLFVALELLQNDAKREAIERRSEGCGQRIVPASCTAGTAQGSG